MGQPPHSSRAMLYMPGDDLHKIQKAATLESIVSYQMLSSSTAIRLR
jgi:hypothetical protein